MLFNMVLFLICCVYIIGCFIAFKYSYDKANSGLSILLRIIFSIIYGLFSWYGVYLIYKDKD